MIRIAVRFLGLERMRRQMERRAAKSRDRLTVALDEAAAAVHGEAQRLIQDPPKTGRVYTTTFFTDKSGRLRRGKKRPAHQASAPGEAPANDYSTLVNSIVIDRTDIARGRIVIAATAKHARPLELGTRTMAPRPFLRRALRTMRGRVIKLVREAL